jgi:hypothetical protein
LAFYSPISRTVVRDNGQFAVGARVEFFDAGTNTVRTMYQDGALNTPFDPDDITSDANAQLPNIWGQGNSYKAVIKSSGGVVIDTIDNIPGDVTSGGGGGGGGSTTQVTGDIQPSILSGTRSGFVRANAGTIGSAASGATERANADTQALFVALWSNTLFAVSGGRGASAAADWAGNKTITLPDGRLCALIGADGMGGAATNLFSALTFLTGNAATVGSKIGTATVALTASQNAAHTHTGATSTDGSHQHTGVTGDAGGHSHTGSTSFEGAHSHGVTVDVSGVPLFAAAGGGNVAQAGSKSYSTSTDGAHGHSIATTFDGSHNHGFTSDAAGAHGHTFATSSSGTGAAHANVQPSLVVTYFVKL